MNGFNTPDFLSNWEDATQMALIITVGSGAVETVTATAPKCVIRQLRSGDRDDVLTYEAPFSMARNTGDDELSIAIT